MKTCVKCGIPKPLQDFARCAKHPDGLRYDCRLCYSAYAKDWRLRNRSSVKAKSKANYAKKSEQINAALRAAYALDPVPFRQKNARSYAKHGKKWQPTTNANTRKYRARKAGAEGKHTAADVADLLVIQRGRCAHSWCRAVLGTKFHVDHRNPLARKGSNDRRNLQLLCPKCNVSKGARDPIDVAQRHGLLL